MNLNARIWVPGSSGFVSKNLVSKLKSLGYKKVFTTNRMELDLFNERSVQAFVEHNRIDVIFMTAAKCGGIAANIEDPYSFLLDNMRIQNNIIDAAGIMEVKKVINLGSSCIYPKDFPSQPLKEEYLMKADLEPTNYGYALAKIAGLKLCEYANKKFPKTHFVSLMPSNLYGPGDHFDSEQSHALAALISRSYQKKKEGIHEVTIWGTGKPKREWLYIDDLIDCMIWSVDNVPRDFHGFLNVGTGVDISMIDLCNLINKKMDFSCRLHLDLTKQDGMMKKCLDVTRINSMGWSAKTSLDEGLDRTIAWYLEQKNDKV